MWSLFRLAVAARSDRVFVPDSPPWKADGGALNAAAGPIGKSAPIPLDFAR